VKQSFPLVLPYLDGVILAVNACEGTYLVIDGFGCHFNRAERICGNHDLFSTLTHWRGFHRVLTTQLESADLALGTGAKLRKTVSALVRAVRPEAIVVTPSVTVSVSGQYYDDLARELATQWRIPVIVVAGAILESDWLDGYADTLKGMARDSIARAPARRRQTGRRRDCPEVAVVGNLLARNEYDELANVREMHRLLAMAGVHPAVTWLSGTRFGRCRIPTAIDGVVGLPYGETAALELSNALGVPLCRPGLPIGFTGTLDWVRRVASCFGTGGKRLGTAESEMADHVRRFEWAVARWLAGRRIALCADPHMARAFVPFFREVGLEIVLLAIESRHVEHAESPEFAGIPHVIPDPTHRALKAQLARLSGGIDLVVGNSHRRLELGAARVPFMEFGVPSYHHHAFVSMPYHGFAGASGLLQRMVNLLQSV
jgi:nitrogenase molybdenum-iron protein alpha/beta subunit